MGNSHTDASKEPASSIPDQSIGSPLQWLRGQKWFLTNAQVILIVLIIIGGRLALDFSQRIIEGQQKIAQQRYLESRIEFLEREQAKLQADKQYYSSEAYIETWAHDQGKMVREGEKLVVPIYEGRPAIQQTLTITPQESPRQKQLTPWQVWWILFFDSPPPFVSTDS
jgi:cell division protein FtsB